MITTTIAGSLPKPSWLAAPEKLWAPWKLEGDALVEGQQDAALAWIKIQEDAGIDIVGDGEQFRKHFVHGFLESIDGIDWVTKKALIEEYSGALEEGVGICNQYTLLDGEVLQYLGEAPEDTQTTFSLDDSLAFARDAAPWEDWDSLPEKVTRATMSGPEGTREYIRCLVAREFPGMLSSVEWERINFHNATIRLDEPFIFNKQMCGDALEEAAGTFMEFTAALDKLNRTGGHLVFKPVDDHERRDREV